MLNHNFINEKKHIKTTLISNGVIEKQAEIIADCLVTADAYGVTSHGKITLDAHINRINNGGYNLCPNFQVIRETSAFAVIDGDNAIGPCSASFCINYAIEKCKESGVFTVFSRNNNTFGPAFYYPLLAAQKGMIGIACSNSPAQMAPMGGAEKMLGTNPFSVVIPYKDEPIILDMATSVVAKSKFKEYKSQGKLLPDGWALDKNGMPTNDPDEGISGFVLPMAGFKGYGIAMMIDVIAGVLSGASYLNKIGRFYTEQKASMNVGFNFTVMSPEMVFGKDYEVVMEDFVQTLRNCKTIDGQCIILPGDDRLKMLRLNSGEL